MKSKARSLLRGLRQGQTTLLEVFIDEKYDIEDYPIEPDKQSQIEIKNVQEVKLAKRKASSELPDDSENSHILKIQRVECNDQNKEEEASIQDKKVISQQ